MRENTLIMERIIVEVLELVTDIHHRRNAAPGKIVGNKLGSPGCVGVNVFFIKEIMDRSLYLKGLVKVLNGQGKVDRGIGIHIIPGVACRPWSFAGP